MQVPVAQNDLGSTFATGLWAAVCIKFDIARPPGRRTKACLSPSKEQRAPQFLYCTTTHSLYVCEPTNQLVRRRPALGVSAPTKMRKREFYTRARMRSTAWNAAFTSTWTASVHTHQSSNSGGACILNFHKPSQMRRTHCHRIQNKHRVAQQGQRILQLFTTFLRFLQGKFDFLSNYEFFKFKRRTFKILVPKLNFL